MGQKVKVRMEGEYSWNREWRDEVFCFGRYGCPI